MAIAEASSAVYPARDGNLIEPLVDGGVAFDRIAAAVEAATSSVWVCVAFLEADARFPGGRGTLFDLLDGAAARGVDVRALIWHPHGEAADDMFPGDTSSIDLLAGRSTAWQARWDAVPGRQCQHQKVWLIDAGTPDETAFVGGINITQGSMAGPGHQAPMPGPRNARYGNVHDVHCLVRGPAASDVHDNFVLRWNGATERHRDHGAYPPGGTDDLTAPVDRTGPRGPTRAQIQRSVLPGIYDLLPDGENSVREQYLAAIDGARSSILFEHQVLLSRACLDAVCAALERGVVVVASVPANPMPELAAARGHPGIAAGYDALAACGEHPNFCLVAPTIRRDWGYEDVYVHAKTAVVDDAWATIGSTNLVFSSFRGDTEMNVSFWDEAVARALRVYQTSELAGSDTSGVGDADALRLVAATARDNAERHAAGDPLTGLARAIDPTGWAT